MDQFPSEKFIFSRSLSFLKKLSKKFSMPQNGNLLPKIMSMIIFFVDQNQKNKSLSEILDIKKLMNVDRAIESANGLPNECYTSEQYLEYERNKIFCDKWTVIGVGSSIPEAGDAKPYNLLGIPFISC